MLLIAKAKSVLINYDLFYFHIKHILEKLRKITNRSFLFLCSLNKMNRISQTRTCSPSLPIRNRLSESISGREPRRPECLWPPRPLVRLAGYFRRSTFRGPRRSMWRSCPQSGRQSGWGTWRSQRGRSEYCNTERKLKKLFQYNNHRCISEPSSQLDSAKVAPETDVVNTGNVANVVDVI